jgi:hypothetical protein
VEIAVEEVGALGYADVLCVCGCSGPGEDRCGVKCLGVLAPVVHNAYQVYGTHARGREPEAAAGAAADVLCRVPVYTEEANSAPRYASDTCESDKGSSRGGRVSSSSNRTLKLHLASCEVVNVVLCSP